MHMTNIEFSDQELSALIQLLDIAVKSQGLNVAEAAVILANKVKGSAQPVAPPVPEVDAEVEFADSIESPEEIETEE